MTPRTPDRPITRRPISRRAFTLVEMLMVVAILAIMGALVTPMLGGNDASRLRAAADLLAADLAFAQSESIAHGDDPRVVVFDQAANAYRIATAAAPATPIVNPVGKQPYVVTFGRGRARQLAGVSIYATSLGGDATIGFGIYGQLDQTATASITLASGQRTVTLTLTLDPVTGEATIGQIN